MRGRKSEPDEWCIVSQPNRSSVIKQIVQGLQNLTGDC